MDSSASLRAWARCSALSKFLLVDLGVRHHVRRVEHAELDACGEQADQRRIERAFGQVALLHGIDVGLLNRFAKSSW